MKKQVVLYLDYENIIDMKKQGINISQTVNSFLQTYNKDYDSKKKEDILNDIIKEKKLLDSRVRIIEAEIKKDKENTIKKKKDIDKLNKSRRVKPVYDGGF